MSTKTYINLKKFSKASCYAKALAVYDKERHYLHNAARLDIFHTILK